LLEGRLLKGDGYSLLFGFNRGDKTVMARFGVRTDAARPAAIDLETGRAVPLVREEGRAVLEKALQPGEVWVVRVAER
jgi:hypothetical protein